MEGKDVPIFSLVEGGASHQLFKRFGRQRSKRFLRVAAAAALICWLPLMVLSIIQGVAWGDRVAVPFFYDIAVYTRFLVAVPLLIFAEAIIGPMLVEVALRIIDSGRV